MQRDSKSYICFKKYKHLKMIQSSLSCVHTCPIDTCNFLWLLVKSGTCLKSNYLKIIGLHRITIKKSHLLRDAITNYFCYLKVLKGNNI
jgi:hypothetical protein